jgi:hypothetical protein
LSSKTAVKKKTLEAELKNLVFKLKALMEKGKKLCFNLMTLGDKLKIL